MSVPRVISALLSLAAPAILGQPASPEFAAASIKPNRGGTTFMGVRQLSHGRVVTENTPLRFLIGVAYKRKDAWFEIAGGPAWLDSDGYDITAKANGDATNEQMYPLLQTLLRDRFRLKLRRETRELPVYNLEVGKSGLKLPNATSTECFAGVPGTQPPPRAGKPLLIPCGNIVVTLSPRGLTLRGSQTTTAILATSLTGVLGRTVLDKTGIHGTLDVEVEFTPDETLAGIPRPGLPGALPTPPPSGDAAGPSLYSALKEQLGLTLASAKGPVTVMVVDHVERPTQN
jgi:uncharacterized protein (TIGR03435 family)